MKQDLRLGCGCGLRGRRLRLRAGGALRAQAELRKHVAPFVASSRLHVCGTHEPLGLRTDGVVTGARVRAPVAGLGGVRPMADETASRAQSPMREEWSWVVRMSVAPIRSARPSRWPPVLVDQRVDGDPVAVLEADDRRRALARP